MVAAELGSTGLLLILALLASTHIQPTRPSLPWSPRLTHPYAIVLIPTLIRIPITATIGHSELVAIAFTLSGITFLLSFAILLPLRSLKAHHSGPDAINTSDETSHALPLAGATSIGLATNLDCGLGLAIITTFTRILLAAHLLEYLPRILWQKR